MHAVCRQFGGEVVAREAAGALAVIQSLVMIAEDVVDRHIQLPERPAGGEHVVLLRILVDKVARDHEQVGLLRRDAVQLAGKAVCVERGAHVGIGEQRDAERADGLVRMNDIVCLPDVVRLHPTGRKIGDCEQQGREPGVIPPPRLAVQPLQEGKQRVAQQPEQRQMEQADDGVHVAPCQPDHGGGERRGQHGDHPAPAMPAAGQRQRESEAVHTRDKVKKRRKSSQHQTDQDQKPGDHAPAPPFCTRMSSAVSMGYRRSAVPSSGSRCRSTAVMRRLP